MPGSTPPDPADEPKSTALVRASEAYVEGPVFRGLTDIAAQIIGYSLEAFGVPGASLYVPVAAKAADTALAETVRVIRQRQAARRATVLNLELSETGVGLPAHVLTDDRFLHAYEATLRAALRTYRDDKIRLLARLLASASTGTAVTDVDEYEELLGTLIEMSDREIGVLATLDKHQKPGILRETWWAALRHRTAVAVGVPSDEVPAFYSRMTRTGLYHETTEAKFRGSEVVGRLTPRWYRLRDLIADADGNVIPPNPSTDPVDLSVSPKAH